MLLSQPTQSRHVAESTFIVQGDRNDPGQRRAGIATEVVAKTDVADSLRLKEQ